VCRRVLVQFLSIDLVPQCIDGVTIGIMSKGDPGLRRKLIAVCFVLVFPESCSEHVSDSSSEVAYEGEHNEDSDHMLNG
jgi:hypothetical protein